MCLGREREKEKKIAITLLLDAKRAAMSITLSLSSCCMHSANIQLNDIAIECSYIITKYII